METQAKKKLSKHQKGVLTEEAGAMHVTAQAARLRRTYPLWLSGYTNKHVLNQSIRQEQQSSHMIVD